MKRNGIVRQLGSFLRLTSNAPPEEEDRAANEKTRLAVLIDIENAAPGHMGEVMSRAKLYGEVVQRLAFGTNTGEKWADARIEHAIRWGCQSLANTGKNSADIELAITAMDLSRDREIDGFCIVSSDGDFTPLVMKLRGAGKLVIGFGEKKAPEAFVQTCDKFETIGASEHDSTPNRRAQTERETREPENSRRKSPARKQKLSTDERSRAEFLDLVKTALKNSQHRDGWVLNSVLGNQIRKIRPKVRYSDFGHRTLIGVLTTYPDEIETNRHNNIDRIRLKRR